MISICIPTWEFHGKGVEYLTNLLNTIEKQTITDYEVIISDESETPIIKDCIKSHVLYDKIHYIHHQKKVVSHSENMNCALDHANGDIIKPMFQDDMFYYETALKIMLQKLETHNWAAATTFHLTDECDIVKNPLTPRIHPHMFLGSPSNIIMKRNNVRFDPNLIWLMDMDFYSKVTKIFGLPGIIRTPQIINRINKYRISNFVTEEQKSKEQDYLKNQELSIPHTAMI
jgi:glycosyltransferase involved in cell wall biosynthesis